MFALSNHRILVIRKGALGKRQVSKNIHLYDVAEITSSSRIQALLFFRGRHIHETIEIKSGKTAELIQTIRQLYAQLTIGYASDAQMKLDLCPEVLVLPFSFFDLISSHFHALKRPLLSLKCFVVPLPDFWGFYSFLSSSDSFSLAIGYFQSRQ